MSFTVVKEPHYMHRCEPQSLLDMHDQQDITFYNNLSNNCHVSLWFVISLQLSGRIRQPCPCLHA